MNQTNMVRRALINGDKLTALSAQKRFGIMRLASRVNDLKGILNVQSRWITVTRRDGSEARVKEYFV